MFLSLSLAACNITRNLPPNQNLYSGATINIKGEGATPENIKTLKPALDGLLRPLPNTQVFGFPYKTAIYQFLGEPKNEKSIKAWILKKVGEKPVLANDRIIAKNNNVLEKYVQGEGHFFSKVSGTAENNNRKTFIHYTVQLKPRYHLNEVIFSQDSTDWKKHFCDAQKGSLLSKGNPYQFNLIKTERERIDKAMREKGFYYFRPEYVDIKADSTVGNFGVNLYIQPKEKIPAQATRQYTINDIFVYTGNEKQDTVDTEADLFRGLILSDSSNSYKQRIFTDAIGFRPGSTYNSDLQNISLSRLVNLGNFKFVKNRFAVVNRLDSTLLNVYYNLTPQKKKSVRAELNALSRSTGFAGTKASLNWQNVNTFKGSELLKFSASAGYDFQLGGDTTNSNNKNTRVAFEGSLTFPRFIFPFYHLDPESSRILPKTTISLGTESIIKKGLYTLNSVKGSFGYAWRRGKSHEFTLNPVTLNWIKAKNITEAFLEQLFANPSLLVILENQFIAGSSFSYTYTPIRKAGSNHSSYFNTNLDLAGTLAGFYDKIRNNPEKKGQIFNETFSQYIRLDADYRHYIDINPKLRWVNRAMIGIGVPYGNSYYLPTLRQFFVGGSSSLRAFRARGVGPGAYTRKDDVTEQIFGTFSGDLKLELNSELRAKFNSFIEGAAFVDAGNVWMYKDVSIYDKSALFSKDFYKQLAVGGGLGLRLDFSFVILRLDLATPFRKPWLEENKRWVFDQMNLGNKSWRKENLILNIAVAYPF